MSAARRREHARLTGIFKRRRLFPLDRRPILFLPTAVLFFYYYYRANLFPRYKYFISLNDTNILETSSTPSSPIIQRLVLIIADVGLRKV